MAKKRHLNRIAKLSLYQKTRSPYKDVYKKLNKKHIFVQDQEEFKTAIKLMKKYKIRNRFLVHYKIKGPIYYEYISNELDEFANLFGAKLYNKKVVTTLYISNDFLTHMYMKPKIPLNIRRGNVCLFSINKKIIKSTDKKEVQKVIMKEYNTNCFNNNYITLSEAITLIGDKEESSKILTKSISNIKKTI